MRNVHFVKRAPEKGGRGSFFLPAFVVLVVALISVSDAQAQDGTPPNRPTPPSTTQLNPRGLDIVEPMEVYLITSTGGRRDTTFVGIAKIPDPRRGEEGAFVRHDVETGVMIRISEAFIIGDDGLRRIVMYEEDAAEALLMFRPGPHDVVVSRQGAQPVRSIAGQEVVFDLRELYAHADVNPLRQTQGTRQGGTSPRVALMQMNSTYTRGETVALAVPMVAIPARPQMQQIVIERRDTTIITAPVVHYSIVTQEVRQPRAGVVATIETGYGPRFARTQMPGGRRPAFTTSGWADFYYIDGSLRFEREAHRWIIHSYGHSSVVASDATSMRHHQVQLTGEFRFEYGRRGYVVLQAAGEMSDKPYQQFDWESADYAGTVHVGFGRRNINGYNAETSRYEALFGLRMGENREVEVLEAGLRSRGLGPEVWLAGHLADMRLAGLDFRIDGSARGYYIIGRGAQDDGFNERGLSLGAQAVAGRDFGSFFVYGGARGLAEFDHANFQNGETYSLNAVHLAPAIGIEMRF